MSCVLGVCALQRGPIWGWRCVSLAAAPWGHPYTHLIIQTLSAAQHWQSFSHTGIGFVPFTQCFSRYTVNCAACQQESDQGLTLFLFIHCTPSSSGAVQ